MVAKSIAKNLLFIHKPTDQDGQTTGLDWITRHGH